MPIRFRCVYCNQLLGISRRKAGTIVRCTSCQGQLIVPEPSDAAAPAGPTEVPPAPPTSDPSGPKPFEAAEFDAFLEPLAGGGGPIVASPPALAKRAPTVSEVRTPAFSLSRKGLWIACTVSVISVGLAFAAGIAVGMALH